MIAKVIHDQPLGDRNDVAMALEPPGAALEGVMTTGQALDTEVHGDRRQMNRRKEQFLGVLAHELRNPLAPMRFALEILRQPDLAEVESARALEVLGRQVTRLAGLVDDLLDVSHVTQGKLELRREAVDVAVLVNSVVERYRPAIDAGHLTCTVSLPAEPVILQADPVRLKQTVVNLLDNAVKFTPPGGRIWVIAETTGDVPERQDGVCLRVRDTGIGIDSHALPHVFEMFMQGDRSPGRTRAGLGVGLTLVKYLTALHGGTVGARSDGLNLGAEFTVCLPIDPDAHGQIGATLRPVAAAEPLRILVAEDNEDGREMLSQFLTLEGHTVASAADGPQALAAAAAFRPDVAILDIGMPGLSGYEVAQRLRPSAWSKGLRLVALSGLGQREDTMRSIEAGFDYHFIKPVDIAVLRALLASLVPAGRDQD